jgi:hypothetical protein
MLRKCIVLVVTCGEGCNLSTRDLGFIYVSSAGRIGCEVIHPAQPTNANEGRHVRIKFFLIVCVICHLSNQYNTFTQHGIQQAVFIFSRPTNTHVCAGCITSQPIRPADET